MKTLKEKLVEVCKEYSHYKRVNNSEISFENWVIAYMER